MVVLKIILNDAFVMKASGTTWKVILDEISESSPFTITAALEDDGSTPRRIQITNVLFGDVWICAGQENMQFSVDKVPKTLMITFYW